MRPKLKLRNSRPVQATVGAFVLAIPTSAVALAAGAADAQSALQVTLNRQTLGYGQKLTASGVAPQSDSGRELLLELAPAGKSWRAIGSGRVHPDGHFRIVASPHESGSVRVVAATAGATAHATRANAAVSQGGAVPASDTRRIAVAAALPGGVSSVNALTGQPVDVRGTLLPRGGGRVVSLETSSGGGWRQRARTRTRANGHFDLRYTASSTGQRRIRVRFAGDRLNGAATTRAGKLTVYRESLASWYNDGGNTACGFHAGLGVANRDLPCGTRVTFHYGSHTVTAVVDDRGPYVGGRDWDLNQNTAGALGFDGVASVWSSR